MREHLTSFLIAGAVLTGLLLSAVLHFAVTEAYDEQVLMITMIIGTIPLAIRIFKSMLAGQFGVDLIAIAAIVTAFLTKEYLAGSIILLMLSGGEALESYALRRSTRELKQLLSQAPSVAHRVIGSHIEDLHASQVALDDLLLVKPGEIIPVDGLVVSGESQVDESTVTGEGLPAEKTAFSLVYSGTVNKSAVLTIRALRLAKESHYELIVRLVREAQSSKAPMVRLADRYAVWFTAVTFVIAAAAWLVSQDLTRFLAVLVVATPCPLILAAPIAIISGISKSASRGIVIKNGGALERLGESKGFIFDKTGTLTLGTPRLVGVQSLSGLPPDEIVRIAASIDQLSTHIFARALVNFTRESGRFELEFPNNFAESLGNGVQGEIGGRRYWFGKLTYLMSQGCRFSPEEQAAHDRLHAEGNAAVFLAGESGPLGYIIFSDVIRPEIKAAFASIREHQIEEVFMLTGDKQKVAARVAEELSIRHFKAELLPEEKVAEVKRLRERIRPLVMVGDGINDAPAMAAADVGIALAAHGSSAASEAGDVVIMVNNFMRVHDVLHIAQRVMSIAKQSIFLGMGISTLLMVIAALGYIEPVYGALLQEILDVAVILNSLRVNFEPLE